MAERKLVSELIEKIQKGEIGPGDKLFEALKALLEMKKTDGPIICEICDSAEADILVFDGENLQLPPRALCLTCRTLEEVQI